MFYLLYKTVNKLNDRYYIGAHATYNLEDDYLGSGKALKLAIKKYGKENFIRTTLKFCLSREDMFKEEENFLTEEVYNNPVCYNLRSGGLGTRGMRHSEETKEKIRQSAKGKVHSEKTKEKMKKNNWAKKDPEAQRRHAIKAASYSKTAEHKANISAALREKTGKGSKQKIIICPFCGRSGGERAMKRWHFDNCRGKSKPKIPCKLRCWVTDGKIDKFVPKEGVESFLTQGWRRGRSNHVFLVGHTRAVSGG